MPVTTRSMKIAADKADEDNPTRIILTENTGNEASKSRKKGKRISAKNEDPRRVTRSNSQGKGLLKGLEPPKRGKNPKKIRVIETQQGLHKKGILKNARIMQSPTILPPTEVVEVDLTTPPLPDRSIISLDGSFHSARSNETLNSTGEVGPAIMVRGPDPSMDEEEEGNYEITLFEDLAEDKDLSHRNKHIPGWAKDEMGILRQLFCQLPYTKESDKWAVGVFPKVIQGFKLFKE